MMLDDAISATLIRKRRYRFTIFAVFLGIAAMLVSGCTPPESSQQSGEKLSYTEPAWMAETRQQQEKEAKDDVACMAEQGWEIVINPDFSRSPVNEIMTDEQDKLFTAASINCFEKLSGYHNRTEAEWRVKYQHALDTRNCLVAEGYTISEPPSEDSWVDAGMTGKDQWVPFQEVVNAYEAKQIELDANAYHELYAKCPQDGPVAMLGDAEWN